MNCELKNYSLLILVLAISMSANAQRTIFFRLYDMPGFSWKEQGDAKMKLINPLGISIGYEFSHRISVEAGLRANKVGYKLIRVYDEIVVINGFNTYTLKGTIPTKQLFTEKFLGIPFQVNYSVRKSSNLDISLFANVALNVFYKDKHES